MPARLKGYTQAVIVGGQRVHLQTGEYEDGTLGEINITVPGAPVLAQHLVQSVALSVSIGLQFGVPLEEFVEEFLFSRFEPTGMVLKHSRIMMATSILDFVFRDLAIHYLGRDNLAHKPLDQDQIAEAEDSNEADR